MPVLPDACPASALPGRVQRTALHAPAAAVILLALAGCAQGGDPVRADAGGMPTAAAAASRPAPAAPGTIPPPGRPPLAVTRVALVGGGGGGTLPTFAPADTVHLAVGTAGHARRVPVSAHWTDHAGRTVGTETRVLDADGPGAVEFQARQPGGWAPGTYTVEVAVGGTPVRTEEFAVR